MFQNPMMLMMIFAAGMMFGMPYLMVNSMLHITITVPNERNRKTWTLRSLKISRNGKARYIISKVLCRMEISKPGMLLLLPCRTKANEGAGVECQLC
jgi:hypothetical protein